MRTMLSTAIIVATAILFSCDKKHEDGCDSNRLPIVAIHGMLASGDTYARPAQWFSDEGSCSYRFFVFDWNTLNQSADHVGALDRFIDSILNVTGAQKVDLMGHSAGSGLGYNYLNDAGRAAKVAHFAYLAGGPQTAPAGPNGEVPTINVYSDADKIVTGADMPNATNVHLVAEDHYEVATGRNAFNAVYRFFIGKDATGNERNEDQPKIFGRAVTLGENTPEVGATVEVYEVSATTGQRLTPNPALTLTTSTSGHWGPFVGRNDAHYEFYINPARAGARSISYFRKPFRSDDKLVYLRTFPVSGIAGTLLAGLPSDDAQSVVCVFTANQAVINGRDNLMADSRTLSMPQFAADTRSTIAFFLFDGNNNQQTDMATAGLFSIAPAFLSGVDMFLPTNQTSPIPLIFNGQTLNLPRRRSNSDGVMVAVFP